MKESLSMTAIFQIVVLFILLFTAIMALTINNSNAFGVKDEIVTSIETSNGNFLVNGNLNEEIKGKLTEASYRTTGTCNKNGDEDYQAYDRSGDATEDDGDASICIKEVRVTEGIEKTLKDVFGENKVATNEFLDGVYYQIKVFYQLDIPIVKQVYQFESKGETKIIYKAIG